MKGAWDLVSQALFWLDEIIISFDYPYCFQEISNLFVQSN